jgi:hypothetical protein
MEMTIVFSEKNLALLLMSVKTLSLPLIQLIERDGGYKQA